MTSHEYAQKLRAVSELLESRPSFEMPSYTENYVKEYGVDNFNYHSDKKEFLTAVRAIGSGRKDIGSSEVNFWDTNGILRLVVNRDAVCRIVKPAQPAEYDCEPLLSQEEEATLGGAA